MAGARASNRAEDERNYTCACALQLHIARAACMSARFPLGAHGCSGPQSLDYEVAVRLRGDAEQIRRARREDRIATADPWPPG